MFRPRTFVLPALAFVLVAPANAQDSIRILGPQSLSGAGAGWSVNPATGHLGIAFPFTSVPGDIPIQLPFLLKGSQVTETRKVRDPNYDPILDGPKPTYILVTNGRPVRGGISFGCITSASTYDGYVESPSYILEDGSQFRERDIKAYNPYVNLDAPGKFGLAPKTWNQVKTHISTSIIVYDATAADLGNWATKAASLAPVGFLPGATGYKVLMDKDRARIYAYVSDFNAWVPILWLDRFGHSASFQWKAGVSGTNTVFSVKALNQNTGQPDRGVQVQWAVAPYGQTETDQVLLRADYIGLQAPSIQVWGYSGGSSTAGAALRPTHIASGRPSELTALAAVPWLSGGLPIPAESGSDEWAPVLNWAFTYDVNKAEIVSFTDALNATTTFAYTNLTFYDGSYSNTNQVRGVTGTTTDSPTGTQFTRSWTRVIPVWNSTTLLWSSTIWKTSLVQRFTTGDATDIPTQEWTFAGPNQAVAYGNGALLSERLFTASKVYVTQVHVPGTYGIDASLSNDLGPSLTVDGSPTQQTTTTRDSLTGLPNGETLAVGGITWQTVTYTNVPNLSLLDPGPLTSVATQRRVNGSLVAAPTHKIDYDPTTGFPAHDYMESGTLQRGRSFGYDGEGHLNSVASYPVGTPYISTAYTPGSDGLPTHSITTFSSPNGGVTNFTQDWSYSPAGRVLTATDGRGVITTTTYDSRGRVRRVATAGSPTTNLTYPTEFVRSWSTSAGASGSETSDAFGLMRSRTSTSGITETPTYDLLGRTTVLNQVSGGTSRNTYATYDAMGRTLNASSYASPLSQTLAYVADGTSAKVTTTLSNGVVSGVWTDPLRQTIQTQDPWSTVTSVYNALSLPTQVVQTASGTPQTRSSAYTALGDLTSRTEPETGSTAFTGQDAMGNPGTINDGVRSRTLAFDGLGRLRSVTGGSESLSWVFDGLKIMNASTVSNGQTVTQDYAYKAASSGARLASETLTLGGVGQTTLYDYDAYGRLQTLTYPSTRTAGYGYDSLGRVASVTQNSIPLATVHYDPIWGSRSDITFASTAKSSWVAIPPTGVNLQSWIIAPMGAPAETYSYSVDGNGNLNKGGGWDPLTHDTAGRLTAASGFGETVALAHDGFGNNTSSTTNPAPTGTNNFGFSAMPNNKVPLQTSTPTVTATGWIYRANGEADQLGTATGNVPVIGLSWDGLGRMAWAGLNGTYWSNTYAPSGMRVQLTDSATPANSRRYAYTSGGLLLGEYTTANVWKRDVIYLGGDAITEIDAAGTHELHNDHLGSPRVITNRTTGAVEGRQVFGPYGEKMPAYTSGYAPLTGYTGHAQQDPSGLTYMRGRFYSQAWHRFLNSDQGVDPSTFNQMAYVGGSPVQATDPSGFAATYVPTWYGEVIAVAPWIFGSFGVNSLAYFDALDASNRRVFSDVSGPGMPGVPSPQTPLPLLNKEKCLAIQEMKKYAATHSPINTARHFSITGTEGGESAGSWSNRYLFTNPWPYQNLTPTTIGSMDVDWYLTLGMFAVAWAGPSSATATYVIGKRRWEAQSSKAASANPYGQYGEGIYHPESVFQDPGERTAVAAIGLGLDVNRLWTDKWFEQNCAGLLK